MVAPSSLADLALLTIVMAHGTDADLDPRETQALVHQLHLLWEREGGSPSGGDLSDLVEQAVEAYGELSVIGLEHVVARLGQTLERADLARAYTALAEVANADGHLHTMEAAFLRHVAQAWRLPGVA